MKCEWSCLFNARVKLCIAQCRCARYLQLNERKFNFLFSFWFVSSSSLSLFPSLYFCADEKFIFPRQFVHKFSVESVVCLNLNHFPTMRTKSKRNRSDNRVKKNTNFAREDACTLDVWCVCFVWGYFVQQNVILSCAFIHCYHYLLFHLSLSTKLHCCNVGSSGINTNNSLNFRKILISLHRQNAKIAYKSVAHTA